MARKDVFAASSKIVDDTNLAHGNVDLPPNSRPAQSNLLRMVSRVRQRLRPTDPVDLDFEIDYSYIPEDFAPDDIEIEGQRHLLFVTNHQLRILAKAKTWYLDATFKVVRRPFMQMFSVHAFLRSGDTMKQVPLAFCLMSRRRRLDYKMVLDALKAKLVEPCVVSFVADFESAVWLATRDVFPGTTMRGCAFHWAQAINRKVGELGLQTAYQSKDVVHKFIRKIHALPFLPAEHIGPAFRHLCGQTTSTPLLDLLKYVRNTWLQSTIWTVDSWSVFMQPIRTNNDVEGWHRRLNVKANDSKPPVYLLIHLLYKEAALLPLHGKLVSEGKLRRIVRLKTKNTQGKLFALWEAYEEDRLTVSQLLKACGSLVY